MDYPYDDKENQRENYIEVWYQQEKMAERLGGVFLLFAAALIIALEGGLDEIGLAALVGFLAGGITLLIRSRRPQAARLALHFLRYEKQMRNAGIVGMGAALLVFQGDGRPLAYIGAALLAVLALWLQWRGIKIRQLDALSKQSSKNEDA